MKKGFRGLVTSSLALLKTALVKVHNDIALSLDSGQHVILVLLDLSAAFDTIDHKILFSRLTHLGIQGTALMWLTSHLTDRYQSVVINGHSSHSTPLQFGVPQGSVLGPLLFTLYTTPLGQIIRHHDLKFHQYADDNQLYLAFAKTNTSTAISQIEDCMADIKGWMTSNKLQLNDGKTEILLIRSRFDQSSTIINSIQVGSSSIQLADTARNIGFLFDTSHDFKKHIIQTCQSIYLLIRRIGFIRKYLSQQTCLALMYPVLSAKLDYCNALLCGLPDSYIRLLQRVQNSAARLITKTKKRDHITPVLKDLHWLPVAYRIRFKILLLTYKSIHGLAPSYLAELIEVHNPCRSLRSSRQTTLKVPRTRLKSYGDRSFSYCSSVLWNKLPAHIRSAPTIHSFRSKLKTYFFERAFQ